MDQLSIQQLITHDLKRKDSISTVHGFNIVIKILKLYRSSQTRSEQALRAERGSERPAVIFHIKV